MPVDESTCNITGQMKKDGGAVAEELNAWRRHAQRPRAECLKTGGARVQGSTGRPNKPPPSDAEAVLDAYRRRTDGARLTVRRPRRAGCDVWHARAYAALKSRGPAAASPAKSRPVRRGRYERPCSNATRHTDWRVIKDARMKGRNSTTHLDGAPRCVAGSKLFREAASENAVTALRWDAGRVGVPATIL